MDKGDIQYQLQLKVNGGGAPKKILNLHALRDALENDLVG